MTKLTLELPDSLQPRVITETYRIPSAMCVFCTAAGVLTIIMHAK